MPTISVILPVYNSSEYLLEALESITNQTFTDWEMIAIDDGSTDNSLQILQNYAQKEPRLRIISRENRGLPTTLNEGIDNAKGAFIARMDSDDISLPERFEKQLNFLEKNNLDMCGTQYNKFGQRTGISNLPLQHEDCCFRLLLRSAFAHPTVMARSKLFVNFKYNENMNCAQDYDLWCRLALKGFKLGNLPEVLLNYRFSSNQISTNKEEKQMLTATAIAKSYWSTNAISQSIPYPECIINSNIKDKQKIKSSIKSLNLLKDKFSQNNYVQEQITIEKNKLFYRSTSLGLKYILPLLKHDQDIILNKKLLYALLSITRITCFKDRLKKSLPLPIIDFIRNKIIKFD